MFKHLSKTSLLIFLSIIWTASIVLAVWCTSTSVSTRGSNFRIVYVNIQKIGADLPATKQLQIDLEKILKKYHQQLEQIELELKNEHQSLISAQNKPKSSQEIHALELRKSLFEAKVAQTQKDVELKQQSINQRHTKMIQKIHTILMDTVKEMAEKEKFDVILSEQHIVYAKPERDYTDKVFEKVKAATSNIRIEQEKS